LKQAVASLTEIALFLVLDNVQDPHNLGACLRTADATGVHGVIITKDNATGITPTVCKVASGAAETVPVYQVTNLARTLRWLKGHGIWVIGAAGETPQTAYQTDFTVPLAIVVGAEGKGMRRLTKEQCDLLVKLPMLGQVKSLNLSVATGVLLYEVVRQRLLNV
jgi:23S rRNA (guanosine2251-2'-O)-methyltransferase